MSIETADDEHCPRCGGETIATLRAALDDALELLAPFALMASAYDDKPDMHVVCEVNHQTLRVAALRAVRNAAFGEMRRIMDEAGLEFAAESTALEGTKP